MNTDPFNKKSKQSSSTRAKIEFVQNAEQRLSPSTKALRAQEVQSTKPDHLKRFGGVILTFISSIGCILTSPLILLGGIIGVLTGLITKRDLYESGLQGAKIGSLGFIFTILLGIELAKTTTVQQDVQPLKNKQQKPDVNASDRSHITINGKLKKPEEINTSTTYFPTNINPLSGTYKETKAIDFKRPKEIDAFIKKINEIVSKNEAKITPKTQDNSSNVKEKYIERLIAITKTISSPESDFWDRLEMMTDKDIKSYVSKLSSIKESGKHSSSELDYLWRHFKGLEFEPSLVERKRKKFKAILEALSLAQFKASLESPDFLNIMNKDVYAMTAANSLNRNQLALFATNTQRHETLNTMIKKLKPDAYLLGKLAAIIPYATEIVREALIDKLAHLPHLASFKIELIKLAEYYITINKQANQITINSDARLPDLTQKEKSTHSKWAKINANTKPIYATLTVKTKDMTDKTFEEFIQCLNAKTFLINKDKIIKDLNSMPDARIKMIIERAALPDYKNLLNQLWIIESKPINHSSYIQCRKNRLRIVLENLSEEQLKSSLNDNKFWEIFSNTQQPYCKMAAKVLNPEQFKIIISNTELENHSDFAKIITYIRKDTPKDKERLNEIIRAILPYTTPWFALALELKIKDLLTSDKHSFDDFNANLRKYLSESMEKQEVNAKYKLDTNLNKNAISNLMQISEEDSYQPAFK